MCIDMVVLTHTGLLSCTLSTDKPEVIVHARVNAARSRVLVLPSSNDNSSISSSSSRTAADGTQLHPPAPPPGSAAVMPLDWEDAASAAAAAALITSHGAVDLIIGSDLLYPDPARAGAAPSADALLAVVRSLGCVGHTRVLLAFEARAAADELRGALMRAAAGKLSRLSLEGLPSGFATATHVELYELRM